MAYTLGLIGCGRVSGAQSQSLATHLGALRQKPVFELRICVDTVAQRARETAQRFGFKTFSSVNSLESGDLAGLDVLVLATPPDDELAVEALRTCPKVLILEKPAFRSARGVADFSDELEKTEGTKVLMNFPRLFSPSYRQVIETVRRENLGTIREVFGLWSRGFGNNGIHMMYLLAQLGIGIRDLGGLNLHRDTPKPDELSTLQRDHNLPHESDLIPSRFLELSASHSFFELRIEYSEGALVFRDSGFVVEVSDTGYHPGYPGYPRLVVRKRFENTLEDSFVGLYDKVESHLAGSQTLTNEFEINLQFLHEFFNSIPGKGQ